MAFIDRISADLTAAMRAKDTVRLGTLRMTKAALMNKEVERGRALDDTESLGVVSALIKQRRDSIEQFRAGGREDLATKEEAEVAVLECHVRFLPRVPALLERRPVGVAQVLPATVAVHAGGVRLGATQQRCDDGHQVLRQIGSPVQPSARRYGV